MSMGNVINMRGETMEETAPRDATEQAWNDLFRSVAVLKEEAQKPGFGRRSFTDEKGQTWGVTALVRLASRSLNFVGKAGENGARA